MLCHFQKLKKDLENLFFQRSQGPFFTFFKKIDIITDVIIPIAAILKIFLYHFFVTFQSMILPNFMSKAFSY